MNRYRELRPLLAAGARVLDIGAGGGEVVYVLRRFGFEVRGLEPDEAYARHAREALGVPVQTGFVQDVSFPPGSFDAITMYHALEHVEDPVGVLTVATGWLAEQGVLLVEVPNIEARSVHPAHRFHFAHFYSFNRGTLEAVGRAAGLTPERTLTSSDGGNLTAVFRAVQAARPTREWRGNYERLLPVLRRHSRGRYYLSGAPYIGPFSRLRCYLQDSFAARGQRDARAVIDRLIAHV